MVTSRYYEGVFFKAGNLTSSPFTNTSRKVRKMLTKTVTYISLAVFLFMCIPQQADANQVKEVIRQLIREGGRWISSPRGQRKMRDIVEKPGADKKAEKVWDWVKDTASDIKESIEDGINDLKEVNPMCVICSMTGIHICSGGCSGSCSY